MVIQRKDRIFLSSYTKVAAGRDETTGPGRVLEGLALGNRLGLERLTGGAILIPLQFTLRLPVPPQYNGHRYLHIRGSGVVLFPEVKLIFL